MSVPFFFYSKKGAEMDECLESSFLLKLSQY
jgi:hypothetical protein